MLEKNQRIRAVCAGVLDAALLFAAYLLAVWLRFNYLRYFYPGGAGPALDIARSPRSVVTAAAYAVAIVVAYALAGLYDASRLRGLWQRCQGVLVINTLAILGLGTLFYYFRVGDFSRMVVGLFYALGTLFVVLRWMCKRWLDRSRRRRGLGLRHVLLVGGGPLAAQYLLALEQNPYYGIRVDGCLCDGPTGLPVPCLGPCAALDEYLAAHPDLDEVVAALEGNEVQKLAAVFAACDRHGMRITMVPFYNEYLPARPTIDVIGDCKLINVRQTPFDNLFNAAVKRGLDILGSLFLIVLTSPVLVAVAVGVKLSSPGPVIFKQERVGLNKRPFMMYKFRSMRVNAAQDTAWSTGDDPRRTRFGSFIRKFSLDELPQFFNVLKGDMSLVGPRPEIPYHVAHFQEEIPRYLVRQQVRPGCTGWAQIHGLRGDTDIAERIRYDIWYIENWTVALDIKIIFRTVFGGKMVNDETL